MPTFALHTYGCQMNVRDSDILARRLRAKGLTEAETEEEADVVIVNSCSVRGKAEDKALGKLGLLCATKRDWPNRVIGLTGCMAQRLGADIFKKLPRLSFSVGPRAESLIPQFVERCLETGAEQLCDFEVRDAPPETPEMARADLSRLDCLSQGKKADKADDEPVVTVAAGPVQSFVTILYGCSRRCSYCIVPSVRGEEQSRDPRDILLEVKAESTRGVRDVCLLGQSVMRYGLSRFQWPEDIPSPAGYTEPMPRLLEYIAREVPDIPRIRFTSGHPNGVTAELVHAMANIPAVCPHLHLPMQSGSDRILKEMNRGYDSATYLDAVRRLRAAIPDIAITTDIIVGYPGETEADFEATRRVMEEADFDNSFIFKYSPRPGTRSALLEDSVSDEEKCRRDAILLADQDARGLRNNARWVGRIVEVLCEGPSLRNAARWAGRSPQNKIVLFEPDDSVRIGSFVRVRVKEAHAQTLYGDLVRNSSAV